MRKILVPLMAVLLAANIAWAEKPVPLADANQSVVATTPAIVYVTGTQRPTAGGGKPIASLTAKRVKALMGQTDGLQKETVGLRTDIKTGLGDLKTSLDGNTTSTNEAVKNISGLTTAVENTAKTMTGMDGKLSQNFWLTLAGLALLLIFALLILSRIRASHIANEKKGDEILEAVQVNYVATFRKAESIHSEVVATRADVAKIPDVLVKLKRLATVLEFKDVDGKGLNVTVMPFVKDGTVFTLRLPDSVDLTAAYTDSTIPRTPAKNRSHLVSTNEEVLKAYYAGEFNGHDDASSLKLRIIKAAFRNGEIVENK